MIKIRNKRIALLLVLAMMATMFIGIGTASADTSNTVVGAVNTFSEPANDVDLASLLIDEIVTDNLVEGDVIVATLPDGVEYNGDVGDVIDLPATTHGTTVVGGVVATTLEIKSATVANIVIGDIVYGGTDSARVKIPFNVNIVTIGDGAIKVNIAAPGTAVSEGDYTIGRFSAGKASASALSTPTRGSGDQTLGAIRLLEDSVGGVAAGDTVSIKLPAGIEWTGYADGDIITGTNGRDVEVTDVSADGRKLTLTFGSLAGISKAGIYDITSTVWIDKQEADKGDVTVSFGGTANVTPSDLVIGKYGAYGVEISVDSVKELKAGKFYQKTDEILIEETIAKSLIEGRDLSVTVPDGVKITDVEGGTYDYFGLDATIPDPCKNYIDLTVTNGSDLTAQKSSFKLVLSIRADFTGDVTATIEGAGIESQELVIAKVIKPVSISCEKFNDVKIGVQNQAIADIVITEAVKEAALKSYSDIDGGTAGTNGAIKVTLTQGAQFVAKPAITVTDGNIALDTAAAVLSQTDEYNDTLSIPIKSESTKASTIKLSNVQITLDRTLPEGALFAKLAGSAVTENYSANAANGTFDVATMSKAQVANVVTPAPGEENNVSVFTFGSTTYTINGKAQTMVAPAFAQNNRTYLPVRDVAYALGISDANIIWDQATQTATLMSNGKVVQLKLGSNVMTINSAPVTMDVTVIAQNNRIFLPAAWPAMAFGFSATWDAAANTVTIK